MIFLKKYVIPVRAAILIIRRNANGLPLFICHIDYVRAACYYAVYHLLHDIKVNLLTCVIKPHAIKTCGKQKLYCLTFLTWALNRVDEVYSPADLPPRPTYRILVPIGWEVACAPQPIWASC